LVQLLYGEQSFSGKLPYTVAKNESDYVVLSPVQPSGIYAQFPQDDFTEGVYTDYRDFDAKNITPRFEFGFGLSYTTFGYSDLLVSSFSNVSTAYYPTNATIAEGGLPSLWDVVASVKATVTNTGSVEAAEVAQLYVGIPGGPVKQLRGFEKVNIPVGETVTVQFDLTRRDLSEWSVVDQSWVLQQGAYQIYVGSSSRDLPLTGTLTIGAQKKARRSIAGRRTIS
jgi:beta-glucosidase